MHNNHYYSKFYLHSIHHTCSHYHQSRCWTFANLPNQLVQVTTLVIPFGTIGLDPMASTMLFINGWEIIVAIVVLQVYTSWSKRIGGLVYLIFSLGVSNIKKNIILWWMNEGNMWLDFIHIHLITIIFNKFMVKSNKDYVTSPWTTRDPIIHVDCWISWCIFIYLFHNEISIDCVCMYQFDITSQ